MVLAAWQDFFWWNSYLLTLSTKIPSLIYFSEENKTISARKEGCLLTSNEREPSCKNAVIRGVYIWK